VQRDPIGSQAGTTGSGASRTPLQHLDGLITPSELHFERHHSGIPDIDPAEHKLYVHGLVERPLSFDLDALARYPMVSRIQFLECSGNSGALTAPKPVQGTCSALHGLVSVSEWGGVPLSVLLDEAGVSPKGKWIVAGGADAAMMSRSVPMEKVLDDAIVALYQNGERLRPGNGYPMRLFLPGWEGNASVKWLRSIKVTDRPAMTKDETSKYSDLDESGQAELFTFPMGVKSVITSPSPGLSLGPKGMYQISGIAWSGAGKIREVEVSADGGQSWVPADLDEHVLSKCVTRFRAAWKYDGGPAVLMSRAIDETSAVQPTRNAVLKGRSPGAIYHVNAIQPWRIDEAGEVHNVYV
jgi:sulfane dehydrogenase subunit SoxC